MVDCTQAKEFALAHWLVNGADGGRLFVRCFGGDGALREDVAGDAPASLTAMVWDAPSKSWTCGASDDGVFALDRRMTARLGDAVAFAGRSRRPGRADRGGAATLQPAGGGGAPALRYPAWQRGW